MDRKFSGGVFSDKIDGGRCGAELDLSPTGIRAATTEGDRFEIGFRDCQVEVGGFSGRMVFCRNRDRSVTIFCEDKRFARALSEASSGILDSSLNEQLRKSRGQANRGRLLGTGLLIGIAVIGLASYFGIRAAAKATVAALPISVDQELGTAAYQSMDVGGARVDDPVVTGAIESIVERLAPHSAIDGLQYEIDVIDSPQINAFALPGGKIVVFTGLIEKSADANQLAGVIGHEMSHATLRHGLQRISQTMGFWAAASLLLGDTGGLLASGADLFELASINSYSRGQENEADREGVRMLHAAGIDPSSLPDFFEILEKEHGDLPDMASWISTHPQHSVRISNLREQIDALPARQYQPFEFDWAEVQRRAANDLLEPDGDR